MKNLLIALLCAALLCTSGVWAAAEGPSPESPAPSPEAEDMPEEGALPAFPSPAPDSEKSPDASASPKFQTPAPESEAAQAGGTLRAILNGEPLTLDFDPDPQFSMCEDGYVQASFYAYGAAGKLYELYLVFPQTVAAGDIITAEGRAAAGDDQSGLMMFVSDNSSDVCSLASQYADGVYPEGSGYEATFSQVSASGTMYTFTGSLKATLVVIDEHYNSLAESHTLTASFTFTMDLSGASAEPGSPDPEATPKNSEPPKGNDAPTLPYSAIPTPPAKLVTPADAKKI
ncbi:MAG: hypothetical protein ACI4MF_13435 [Candidatus Faecivicinus sp.]